MSQKPQPFDDAPRSYDGRVFDMSVYREGARRSRTPLPAWAGPHEAEPASDRLDAVLLGKLACAGAAAATAIAFAIDPHGAAAALLAIVGL